MIQMIQMIRMIQMQRINGSGFETANDISGEVLVLLESAREVKLERVIIRSRAGTNIFVDAC